MESDSRLNWDARKVCACRGGTKSDTFVDRGGDLFEDSWSPAKDLSSCPTGAMLLNLVNLVLRI